MDPTKCDEDGHEGSREISALLAFTLAVRAARPLTPAHRHDQSRKE